MPPENSRLHYCTCPEITALETNASLNPELAGSVEKQKQWVELEGMTTESMKNYFHRGREVVKKKNHLHRPMILSSLHTQDKMTI